MYIPTTDKPAHIIDNMPVSTVSDANSAMQPADERREYLFKILVIGDVACGKTSLIKRFVHNTFSTHYKSTIGADFALKILQTNDNTIVHLQMWDIAGQERFSSMTRVYYREASGALIVFDSNRRDTFDAVLKWKADLDHKVQLADGSPIPCVLVGNKSDLPRDLSLPHGHDMDAFSTTNQFSGWFLTSAKTGSNVEDAILYLVEQVLQARQAERYEVQVMDAAASQNGTRREKVQLKSNSKFSTQNSDKSECC